MEKPTVCGGCGVEFPSRSAVFKHLRESKGACLSKEDFDDFVQYLEETQREKVLLLYGYDIRDGSNVRSGDDAARILLETLGVPDARQTRSFGHMSRASDIIKQDEETGAVTELMATHVPPILTTVDDWLHKINAKLPDNIRLLGRRISPIKRFNAEMFASHRRAEYVLPVDLLYQQFQDGELHEFFERFIPFDDGEVNERPTLDTIQYLFRIKKIMQSLQTRIIQLDESNEVDVLEKKWNKQKRRKDLKKGKKDKSKERVQEEPTKNVPDKPTGEQKDESNGKANAEEEKRGKCLLKRRRYHNFTPKALAHDSLVYRRLDRCYHRATICQEGSKRPFIVFSLTGDMFLQGQVQRIVGLIVALARGVVDLDFVECVFDENYPHLVPTPPAPKFAMYMSEAAYELWEGKAKAALTARRCSGFSDGWNDTTTLQRVDEWKGQIRSNICQKWENDNDGDGLLKTAQQWIEAVLEPWGENAREQLVRYRRWKNSIKEETVLTTETIPPVISLDKTVPHMYQKVLHLLREADRTGRWPATSTKRQLVMVSTTLNGENGEAVTSSLASNLAAIDTAERAASAYIFQEGDGGASGSFTVGAFPGGQQPKSNEEFKELMKAAFELEFALRPDRASSSTIAINRNAQFRPHTDSGAGAGQSTSLIVGLGDYVGGELVVEGERKDIRYKPVEFNGWKERHWTMPFQGERYSLVWFTPKGCEQIRGVDLCRSSD